MSGSIHHVTLSPLSPQKPVPRQGQQTQHMPADAPRKKPQTLAGTVGTPANTDMIERAQAKLVDCETAAADGTGDLAKGVKARARAGSDTEDADAVHSG